MFEYYDNTQPKVFKFLIDHSDKTVILSVESLWSSPEETFARFKTAIKKWAVNDHIFNMKWSDFAEKRWKESTQMLDCLSDEGLLEIDIEISDLVSTGQKFNDLILGY